MKCMECGKEFEPRNQRMKYCSKRCTDAASRRRKRLSICPVCGKKFERSQEHKVYCSYGCQAIRHFPASPYHSDSLDRKCREWGIDYGKRQSEETLALVGRVIV